MRVSDIPKNIINQWSKWGVYPFLGGDPEFFVAEAKRGKILSASDFFPGKDNPIVIDKGIAGNCCSSKLFFDGIQAEIAPTPNSCRELLIGNYRACMKTAFDIVNKTSKILMRPSVKVQRDVINNAHPEARVFGCAPDFNAYTRGINTCAMDASKHPFRYAGGHIHMGISTPYLKKNTREYQIARTELGHLDTVKMLDVFVGILSVLLDNSQSSIRRRSKYGKAGCFRPTPYGIEYRTLSCFWLKSPMLTSLVYGMARLAWNVRTHGADERVKDLINYDEDTIRGIIDESDVQAAKKMWSKIRTVASIIGASSFNPISIKNNISRSGLDIGVNTKGYLNEDFVSIKAVVEYMIENGIDSFLKPPEEEWGLTDELYDDKDELSTGIYSDSSTKFFENKDFLKFQKYFMAKVEVC